MGNSSTWKKQARETLGNSLFATPWLMGLVAYLIYTIIYSLLSSMFVGVLLSGILSYGLTSFFLGMVRKEHEGEIVRMADGIKSGNVAVNALVLGILQGLFIFLWSLLLVIPGIVKTYSYSMAFYISKDHPEYNAAECITESRKMMDGNKFRLFCLQFSFIGWAILCVFTFGIGYLWLFPYMQASYAAFYEEVKSNPKYIGA